MANIIDYTYFRGKISLPQVADTLGQQSVNEFIQIYEPLFLQDVLGYDLWKVFSAGILIDPIPDRFDKILNGVEYQFAGVTIQWVGFSNEQKMSAIANYVYYTILEDNSTHLTRVGTVAPNADNSIQIDPVKKQCDSWKEMVTMLHKLRRYLLLNQSVYPEWKTYPITKVYKMNNLLSI